MGSFYSKQSNFACKFSTNHKQQTKPKNNKTKTKTYKQLEGVCNIRFQTETFKEIVVLSKSHGAKMIQKK